MVVLPANVIEGAQADPKAALKTAADAVPAPTSSAVAGVLVQIPTFPLTIKPLVGAIVLL